MFKIAINCKTCYSVQDKLVTYSFVKTRQMKLYFRNQYVIKFIEVAEAQDNMFNGYIQIELNILVICVHSPILLIKYSFNPYNKDHFTELKD